MQNDEINLQGEEVDRLKEYAQTKDQLKTLRQDLKELKESKPEFEEYAKMSKELLKLRESIKSFTDVHELSDKISELKERSDLIKELIRIQLIENNEEEVENDEIKLKLAKVLKEVKGERKSKEKIHPDQIALS